MNPNQYYMPNMVMMRTPYMMPRNMGLLSRITNGIKTFNWSGLLNGANKTLSVVNQTIPLIRQAAPMFNNMRNMLKLAKVFKKETSNQNTSSKRVQKKEVVYDNYPNFFI